MADTAQGLVVGAAIAPGSFELFAPTGASASYNFLHRGSALAQAIALNALYAAPQTGVLTGQGKISTDTDLLRFNAAQIATAATDQGTGNYADAPLSIGRRSNATLPLNGWIYGLVVRLGPTSGGSLASLETYLGTKAGLTI